MATVMSEKHGKVQIPGWVVDLPSFRRWVRSGDPPEKLRPQFLNGEVWLDLFMEEAYSHNFVKNALYSVLPPMTERLGLFFSDGMLLTNEDAGIATEPDAMFVSTAALDSGRVVLTAGADPEATVTEVTGSPDLVVEVVSRGTEEKDTELLMAKYHDAGISEYWVIDARDTDDIQFDILKRGRKGYAAARKSDGWVKSAVLGKSFRLVKKVVAGYTRFKLEVR
jgi:Uma2 family endonuclease